MRVLRLVCSVLCLMATQVRADDGQDTGFQVSTMRWQTVRLQAGSTCSKVLAPDMPADHVELFGSINDTRPEKADWRKKPGGYPYGFFTSRGFPAYPLADNCNPIPNPDFGGYASSLFDGSFIRVYNKDKIDKLMESLDNKINGNTTLIEDHNRQVTKLIEDHNRQVTNEMNSLITPDVIANIKTQLLPEVKKQVIEDLKRQGLIAPD
jgi:hypothetical protein